MKKGLLFITALFAMIFASAQDMMITSAFDAPLPGGLPKGVEIYVINNIADLSEYGYGTPTNGNASAGVQFTFPAVSASAGDFIYIATDSLEFNNWFGFYPNYVDGSATVNGDDPMELFHNGTLIDVYGVVGTDGTGQPWEYLDGWAYRNNCTNPSTTFNAADWSFSGPDALDGETSNASATTPIPVGSYNCSGVVIPSVSFASATRSRDEDNTVNDTITVSLSSAALRTDTIYLSVGGGTAAYTSDYTTSPDLSLGGMVEVAAGETSFEVIVTMQDDAIFENNETFVLSIDSVSDSLSIGGTASMTYTIVENDPSPFAVVDWASTADNITEASAPFALDMSFNMAATGTDTIWVEVANGAGVVYGAANDYSIDSMITNDTVMIYVNNGDNGSEMNFTVNDDTDVEGTETVTFNIVAVSGGLILGSDLSRVVTITDNDMAPVTYTSIVDIQTPGAGSDSSLYNGDTLTTTGIVTAIRSGSGYYIQESAGGPFSGIYVFDNTNTPARGDSVIISAKVDEYFNSTQLRDVTSFTNVSSGNAFVITDLAPMAVADEQYESVMVRVAPNVVKNNSLGFGEYSLGAGNDTIRIDDFLYSYIIPAVGDSVGITGVGGYSFSNWKIFPRDSADILEISVTPPAVLTITDIQTPFNPDGDSPYDGSVVTTSGIVTAVKDSTGYWIQESAGGAYSGVYVYDRDHFPEEGDSVILTAGVIEYWNLTELSGIVAYENVSSGNDFTVTDVTTDDMNSEQWEGVLVRLTSSTCIDDTNRFGEWLVDDGSGTAKANDFLHVYLPTIGTVYDITGVIDYNFSEYKINPRRDADVVESTVSIESNINSIVNVYPNPASSQLSIGLGNLINAKVSVISLNGKVINSFVANSNVSSINVNDLTSGVYFVEVTTENSVERVKFYKKIITN